MRNRKKYPRGWRKLARACKERANWKCQICSIKHGTKRRSPWTGKEWPVYLQAAHVYHDPHNEAPELACVCPRCHWRFYRAPGRRYVAWINREKHRRLIKQAWLL